MCVLGHSCCTDVVSWHDLELSTLVPALDASLNCFQHLLTLCMCVSQKYFYCASVNSFPWLIQSCQLIETVSNGRASLIERFPSNDSTQVDANLALVGFNAEKDFDAIVSADLFERLKPAPDIFLAAAKQVAPSLRLSRTLAYTIL